MRISMIPSNDVKTIHASQNDTQREWSFEPFDNSGTLIIGEESLANITRIKGNTLAFNQLARYTNHANATVCGLTITNNNNGSFKINGTYNASGDRNMYGYISIISAIQGHKYLVKSTGSLMAGFVYGSASGNRDATTYIVTANSSGNMETAIRLIDSKANNGQVVNETIWVNIFDLTQMFGAGKEPSTVEEFTSLFPLSYYSYQSTLLPFKGTGIKTTGANLIGSVEQGTIDPWSVEGSATPQPSNTRVRSMFIYLERGDYTITSQNGFNTVIDIYRSNAYNTYDIDVSFPNWQTTPKTFTMPYDGYAIILFRRTDNTNITPSDITGEWMYNNNTESVTDLPTLNYFPTGMKSAGNVYDELTESKAITRVGAYTITSFESKSGATANNLFSTNAIVDLIKRPSVDTVLANFSSNYGEAVTMMYLWSNNKVGVAINNFGVIYVGFGLNGSVTTLAQANAYVQSNPITVYYELATPTETDVNTDVFYPVYQYGTEQILPINGANPTTSPFVGDIYYADGLKTDQTFLYRQTPINYNTRQFALVSKNTQTPLTLKDGKAYCNTPLALTNESGFFDAKLKMTDSDGVCYSEKFQIHVERRP